MAAIKRAQAAWWLLEAAAGAREGPQAPEGVGGGTAGPLAGGALDSSASNYTLVVRGSPEVSSAAPAEGLVATVEGASGESL